MALSAVPAPCFATAAPVTPVAADAADAAGALGSFFATLLSSAAVELAAGAAAAGVAVDFAVCGTGAVAVLVVFVVEAAAEDEAPLACVTCFFG